MYIRDLKPVTATHEEWLRTHFGIRVDTPLVFVGWLGTFRPHRKGETSPQFQERLAGLCALPPLLHRGIFYCRKGLCKLRFPSEFGAGEIVVAGAQQAFLAPSLIGHYVTHHRYLPPPAFIDAVLATDPTKPAAIGPSISVGDER